METRVTEIADGVYRLSTVVPEVPVIFNQFLVVDEEPLLFHTGMRQIFPAVSAAVARVLPLERLRWIAFGHYEADECGAMNQWLATSPRAELAHSRLGCLLSIFDQADRPPRPLDDGDRIELGSHTVRFVATPHVPHAWEAGLLFEETTRTLFAGDLFTHGGDGPAITEADIVGPAEAFEKEMSYSTLTPATGATIRRLAELAPEGLALMHGPAYHGEGATALRALAESYEQRIAAAAKQNMAR